MNDANSAATSTAAGEQSAADRASRNASLVLALAQPGDTLLYLLLPIYAATFGVTLPEAGLLLAANRLVRIFTYSPIARLYAARGPRATCIAAAIGATVATLSYATASGLWPLLAGRIVWGLSFAALNVANQALATSVMTGAPARTARSRAIIAAGPTASLILGAFLAHYAGPRAVFIVLVAIAAIAPLFALGLPTHPEAIAKRSTRFSWPGPISTWSFAMGFTIDGIFIFGLGLLAASSYPKGAVIAAGLAMALRFGTEVVFSRGGGMLADRFGARPALVVVSISMAGALCILAGGGLWLWAGVIAIVVLRAFAAALTPPVVAEAHPGQDRVPALASQASWRDIGAGTGPLAAGVLLAAAPALIIYAAAAVLLGGAAVGLLRSAPARSGATAG